MRGPRVAKKTKTMSGESEPTGDAPHAIHVDPPDLATGIAPGRRDLLITFDQDMQPGGYSVCGADLPPIVGPPRWLDARTFALPIEPAPGRAYTFSVNSTRFRNFRGENGVAVEPQIVTFETLAMDMPVEEARHRRAVDELRRAVDLGYSHRDRLGLDWDALFSTQEPRLVGAEGPLSFALAAQELLAHAKDIHINVCVGERVRPTHPFSPKRNYDLALLSALVPGWERRSDGVFTGRFPDGPGYLLVTHFFRRSPAGLEPAYAMLAGLDDARGLVLDVRPNAGGDERLALELAGCFVDRPVVYARVRTRDPRAPGGFASPVDHVVTKGAHRPCFRGPVTVLMGPACTSSGEAFLLMMRDPPRRLLFGERSYGSSGNPRPVDLGNGVIVTLPSWQCLRPDGVMLEGHGIDPDVAVELEGGTADAVLSAALRWLASVATSSSRV